jgi:hypothetical protein
MNAHSSKTFEIAEWLLLNQGTNEPEYLLVRHEPTRTRMTPRSSRSESIGREHKTEFRSNAYGRKLKLMRVSLKL